MKREFGQTVKRERSDQRKEARQKRVTKNWERNQAMKDERRKGRNRINVLFPSVSSMSRT
jgi:hypothetical protein